MPRTPPYTSPPAQREREREGERGGEGEGERGRECVCVCVCVCVWLIDMKKAQSKICWSYYNNVLMVDISEICVCVS